MASILQKDIIPILDQNQCGFIKGMLTTVFGLQRRYLKMASNEKVMNTKVVRLVETNNFAFWIIAI
jgi:hypothetical protein